jgi:hypothetical protein
MAEKEVKDGKNKLYKFVLDTLAQLIQLEEQQMGSKTGLRMFCRLDIGVFQHEEKGYVYWVNEVHRTSNSTLFSSANPASWQILGTSFAAAIHHLYCKKH